LDRRYIKTTRPSIKFDDKKLGPFRVLQKIGSVAYKLLLPKSWRIHDVFHVSLLEPKTKDIIPALQKDNQPPPELINDEPKWEVASILDSRVHRNKLQYRVRWVGYSPADDSWEPADFLLNAPDRVKEFHAQYPDKPKPKSFGARLVRRR
jgi:hypothetical protein